MSENQPSVAVIGDVWNLRLLLPTDHLPRSSDSPLHRRFAYHNVFHCGGAKAMSEMMAAALAVPPGPADAQLGCEELVALVNRFPERSGLSKQNRVYRIEKFLGKGDVERIEGSTPADPGNSWNLSQKARLKEEGSDLRLLVLFDFGNLGNAAGKPEHWLAVDPDLRSAVRAWGKAREERFLIWLPVFPRSDDHVLRFLTEEGLLNRTIVVLEASRLAEQDVVLRDGLSLDSSVKDFVEQFKAKSQQGILAELSGCRSLIVRFGIDAAISRSGAASNAKYSLVFRPFRTLDFYRDDFGEMLGYTAILVASVAKHVAASPQASDDLTPGIQEGLRRCLHFFRCGYGMKPSELPGSPWRRPFMKDDGGGAKTQDREDTTASDSEHVSCVGVVGDEVETDPDWSLLRQAVQKVAPLQSVGVADQARSLVLAGEIVKCGLKALLESKVLGPECSFPVARFGKLSVVDRDEIDSFRHVQNLMRKYLANPEWNRPLGLAVFGPPGGGKSFGVEQVAGTLGGGTARQRALKTVTGNMAQFTHPDDLARILHDAQDTALSGRIPLIFLDEFDSAFDRTPFGWLKYLLPPLQDGAFKYGESTYHLGRAIIVCVGGVSHTFEAFANRLHDRDFVAAKGPDFLSRLRGYVDTRGPNRLHDKDDLYIIRRAAILRSILKDKMDRIMDANRVAAIDPAVLWAFLGVKEFKHGIRSMEAIVDMSTHVSREFRAFTRTALPPEEQLEMHTDAKEFWRLVRESR